MLSQNGFYQKGKEIINNYIYGDFIKSYKKNKVKLLDIGCGDGTFLEFFYNKIGNKIEKQNIEIVGIDRWGGYRKYYKNKNIMYLQEDIFNVDKLYNENYFDIIICSEVIEHVENTDSLIKKIRKILKPEGILYLVTPNLASYHGRLSLLLGYQPLVTEVSNEYAAFGKGFLDILYSGRKASGEPTHHIRIFTYKALKEFIKYHGFEIVQARGFDCNFRFFNHFMPISLKPVLGLICKKKHLLK